MLRILYTGIGANESGIHTIQEFLQIMYSVFPNREFTLEEWLEFSGAEFTQRTTG